VEVEGIVGIEELFYRGTGSEKRNKEYENPRLHPFGRSKPHF
jgi:hypothetical protein